MTRLATKFLLLGGIAGLAVAGVAAASPANSEAPALVVRYNADQLDTDSGAHAVYHRIAKAAEQVCPNNYSLLVDRRIVECRRQAIAAAVEKIHNQRLAAVYAAATSKSG